MKERLVQLLDMEQLSPSKFADIIGVQRSSLSHIISGRNKPSFDFLQKTLKAFPGLNADWLILGEGTMYEKMGRGVSGNLFDTPIEPAETTFPGDIQGADQLTARLDESEPPLQEPALSEKSEHIKGPLEEKDTQSATLPESGRKIVQVMVFYDDDTFRSFDPSH